MIDLKTVCNEKQLNAFIEFEKVAVKGIQRFTDGQLGNVIDSIFGTQEYKIFGVINVSPSKYFRQSKDKALEKPLEWAYKKISELEQILYGAMMDDGSIDGSKLNDMLKLKKPQLYHFVNIPKDKFNLAEFTEKLLTAFG
jgi:hypothetical protein